MIDQTMKYILTPDRADEIAKAVVREYNREFSDSGIKELEKRIDRLEKEMHNLVGKALELPKEASKDLYKRMQEVGTQQEDDHL